MRRSLQLLLFLMILGSTKLYTQAHVIITFKPHVSTEPPRDYRQSVVDKPEKIPVILAEHQVGLVNGILGRLNGNASISDTQGIMVFPREAVGDVVNILITTSINPIVFHGNTVHHWVISKPDESALYQAVRTKDPESGVYSWEITQKAIPATKVIPPDTLIIFARPPDIVVPTGTYTTRGDPHLLLPYFFVKKGITNPNAYLRFLKHSRFYRLIKKVYQDAETRTISQIEG